MTLPVVASFWHGRKLCFLELLCLKSFADVGHRTILYSYDPNMNVPDGVELRDAGEILPASRLFDHKNGFAPFSDAFRLHMIRQTGAIWIDCDVVALKPIEEMEYCFAKSGRRISNSILRLPADSETLDLLIDFVDDENPMVPWNWRWKSAFPEEARADWEPGTSLPLSKVPPDSVPYQFYGPQALTHFLWQTKESVHALPEATFYGLHAVAMRQNYFRPRVGELIIPDQAIALHGVGGTPFRKKFDRLPEFVPPHPKSLVGKLCVQHGIDPMDAPAPVGAAL